MGYNPCAHLDSLPRHRRLGSLKVQICFDGVVSFRGRIGVVPGFCCFVSNNHDDDEVVQGIVI
jgi:hypothetical protein